jgi:outer membrane protein insertion porin family
MLTALPASAQGPGPAPAPGVSAPAEPPPVIGRVSVRGNTSTDSLRILRTFEVRSGETFSAEAVRRGIRKLNALGVFSDLRVEPDTHEGIVDLVVVVRERPRIGDIAFTGNVKRETSELERKLFIRKGEVYSASTVRTQVDTLVKLYKEAGYARAAIATRLDSLEKNQVRITFEVSEGVKVRIRAIVFKGVTAFRPKVLAKKLKSHTKGFFGGGEPDEEKFGEDRTGVESWYHDHGYRDARVTSETLEPGATPRDLALVITVDEGPRYRQGEVTWEGNVVVPTPVLEGLWKRKPGDLYDASRVEKTSQGAFSEYAEHGYLYLQVDPVESVRDSVVDVRFAVTEGRPSNVRMVHINGNKGTREHVVRREIDVREGDRFRRSALVRTQGDIMRLGLFEDVGIDFAAAESTDVDIVLKLKEKQVGTASAGAGYTNETGVTGFLELGHNNVLGNGQSLALHLERGNRRKDYSLSFTEPWFRDTPTLLGFSLYNTDAIYDLYQQRRVGGSGRIGRPLPWPDYSRGSVSYSLEDITITQPSAAITVADATALSSFKIGKAVRTSSVLATFMRNSADNPFYPTKGTRLALDSEVAGGPFGGAVNFHKSRLDGRLYLPSVHKGITTMIKARLGFVAEYLDQHNAIPAYERFRLGGGTTVDPLRGYEDYQVVPAKYDYFIIGRTISKIDSVTTPGVRDTSYTQTKTRVRYPGGRFMSVYTVEQQFPIVHPLHGLLFFDAGNTWDRLREVKPLDLRMSAGIGFRLEIPLLGNVGFDYGFRLSPLDGAPRAVGHFLLGNVNN